MYKVDEFNFDLARMKTAVESKTVSIPAEALTSFEAFDEWINAEDNNYNHLRGKLPNPYGTDYQAQPRPLDLYTEVEMLKFGEQVIADVLEICDSFPIDGDESKMIGAKACAEQIRKHFNIR